MLRPNHLMRWRDCASGAALLALALFVQGCSGGLGFGSPPATSAAPASSSAAPSSPSFKDKITSFFEGASATSPQPVQGETAAGAEPLNDCPLIDIRQGASTLTIGPPADNGDSTNNGAMSVKYQGTFVRAARDCSLVNGQVAVRVGVEGRVIVGPAGGPGQVEIPLRIAVVQETVAGSRLIVTKFVRIPVTVASTTDNPTFTYIEEGLSFPMPRNLDSYTVYIGFDPQSLQAQQKPAPKTKAKPKAKPAATTG